MIHGRLSEALGAVIRNRVTRLATVLIVIVAVLNVVQAAPSSPPPTRAPPVTDFAYPFADLNATSEALVQRRRGGQPELRGVEESRDHVHDVERNPRPIAVASPRRRTSKQRADLCRANDLRSAQRHVLAALVEPHAPGR